MVRLRPFWLFALAVAIVGPFAVVAGEACRTPAALSAWREGDRLASLLLTSISLAALTVVIAVPVGVVGALLLGRIRVPGAGILRGAVVVGLFVPLPVTAVAWQVVLGSWLPPLSLEPGQVAWRPWEQGLLPAAWVHAAAAVPWVGLIAAALFRTANRGLDEDAILTGGPWAVVRRVLLPRAALAAVAAAGQVAATTATEIPVTDAMMVRTIAEDVYTQLVGDPSGVAAAVAVAVPVQILAMVAALAVLVPLVRRFPPAPESPTAARPLSLAPWLRGFASLIVWFGATLFLFVPLSALFWKAGGGGTTGGWSIATGITQVGRVLQLNLLTLADSTAVAAVAGVLASAVALLACWTARDSHRRSFVLLTLTVIAWLTPGPIVGLGLKMLIAHLMEAEEWLFALVGVTLEFPPLRSLLYDQPSPVPGLWAAVVRFTPVAIAILWPAVRALPRPLLEMAALDGGRVWLLVGRPLLTRPAVTAAIVVAGLALGEVSAGKLVTPPGRRVYVLDLFNQMHYGAEAGVAALCLVQLAVTASGAMFVIALITSPPREARGAVGSRLREIRRAP